MNVRRVGGQAQHCRDPAGGYIGPFHRLWTTGFRISDLAAVGATYLYGT